MRAGVAANDAFGTQSYVSDAFCRMVGYPAEELIGARPPYVYWAPEDRERIEEAFRMTLEGRAPENGFELRFRRRDETRFDVLVTLSPLSEGDGKSSGWLATVEDVTARKKAEERMTVLAHATTVLGTSLDFRKSLKELARILVPTVADYCAIHLIEGDERIRAVEITHHDPEKEHIAKRLEELYPMPPSAPVGAPFAIRTGVSLRQPKIPVERLRQAAQCEEHFAMLQTLALESSIVVPLTARGRTFGAVTLVSAESKRVYDPDDLAFAEELATRAALAIDNARLYSEAETARIEAERAAARLRLFLEVSAALAIDLDYEENLRTLATLLCPALADYVITYAVENGDRIRRVGVSHVDPKKSPVVEELLTLRPPRIEDPLGVGLVIRTGESLLTETIAPEDLLRAASGEDHLAILTSLAPRSSVVVPVKARGRTVAAIVLAATDESSRRYTKDDVLLVEELATRVGLLLDNALLYRDARAAIRAREDIVSVVSHDLRNPLQAILSSTEVIEASPDPIRQAKSVQIIARSARQMMSLIRDLLDLTRIESDDLALTKEVTDLDSFLGEVVALFEPIADAKEIRFAWTCGGAAAIAIDRTRLTQAVSNVLANAMKFAPHGGAVTVHASVEEDAVAIAITDNGPGIPPEHLPHVFERFWQGDRKDRRGTGLGLAIARRVMELHGGTISAENGGGGGTTVRLGLPRFDPSKAV